MTRRWCRRYGRVNRTSSRVLDGISKKTEIHQLKQLEKVFVGEGGLSERMTRAGFVSEARTVGSECSRVRVEVLGGCTLTSLYKALKKDILHIPPAVENRKNVDLRIFNPIDNSPRRDKKLSVKKNALGL